MNDRLNRIAAVAAREARDQGVIRARAAVPDICGDAIPAAPARGPMATFTPREVVRTEAGNLSVRRAGHAGRSGARRADVFDLMLAAADRAGKDAPLSKAQVIMGRYYRDLHERHAAAGVRCSSLEAQARSSGGGSGDWLDAVLRDREMLDRLRARIGAGSHKRLRVIRPSARGSRVTIMDRRLVDMVCLGDQPLSEVLRAHGWSENAASRAALRVALADALDRMIGPLLQGRILSAQMGV